MKILRIILLFLSCWVTSANIFAKEGKIKYSKSIEYNGAVANKVPEGLGSLTIWSRIDKKETLAIITGVFRADVSKSMGLVVSDAQFVENAGLKLSGALLYIDITKGKDSENICARFPECKVIDSNLEIENQGELSILFDWSKGEDREWKYEVESSNIGIISSNFMPIPTVMHGLAGLNETIAQQTVIYDISNNHRSVFNARSIVFKNVKEILFNSGLRVCLGNVTTYTFPNGDYILYDSKGICTGLRSSSIDGEVIYKDKMLKIALKNGDVFESNDLPILYIMPNNIHRFQPFKDLKLSGIYKKADNSIDVYHNSNVVERRIMGGTISMGNNSEFCINYDNGYVFTGIEKNFIKNYGDFFNFASVNDAILNNGKLYKSGNLCDIYANGVIVGGRWPLSDGGFVEYVDNVPVDVKYPDGSAAKGEFENNPKYNSGLSSRDYKLKNGTKEDVNGFTLRVSNGEIVPSNLTQIRLMAREKGFDVTVDTRPVYYTYNRQGKNVIHFEYHPEFHQLNDGNYYVPVNDMGLSYPKSLVWKKAVNDMHIYRVESRPIAEEKMHYSDMQLVWVYKSRGKFDSKNYGITKALYIINRETDDVAYDLTSDIRSGNNRSFSYEDKIRLTYHERGKMETCPVCQGSGQMKYWGPPWHTTCSECGGKGWYIEHYW